MLNIKRFIEKVSYAESKQSTSVILPVIEAKGLRDELSKLLADLYELQENKEQNKSDPVIQVELKGGSFK